jgi:hypothetical protein
MELERTARTTHGSPTDHRLALGLAAGVHRGLLCIPILPATPIPLPVKDECAYYIPTRRNVVRGIARHSTCEGLTVADGNRARRNQNPQTQK